MKTIFALGCIIIVCIVVSAAKGGGGGRSGGFFGRVGSARSSSSGNQQSTNTRTGFIYGGAGPLIRGTRSEKSTMDSSYEDNKLSPGAITAIIIVCVFFATVFYYLCFCFPLIHEKWKRRRGAHFTSLSDVESGTSQK